MNIANYDGSPTGLRSIRLLGGKPFQENHAVEILDQLLLPHEFKWITITNPNEAYQAIKSMNIRGAPAIGSLAALSLACGLLGSLEDPTQDLSVQSIGEYLEINSRLLVSARPTAVNLQEAIERIRSEFDYRYRSIPNDHQGEENKRKGKIIIDGLIKNLVQTCESIWVEDVERNKKIGSQGANWLIEKLQLKPNEKISVLTVCNTGSLATSGYGTALGIITSLHELGRLEHTYFMQTTPYLQGARLTSLELQSLNIPSSMVCDSAVGWLVRSGRIRAFIAGADRIAANGDTANKISTYQIALICKYGNKNPNKENGAGEIPVIIAAPRATVDLKIDTGDSIEIEQRSSLEACTVRGRVIKDAQKISDLNQGETREVATVLVTPVNTHALNPAFDVTPAHLIDSIVTEFGPIVKLPTQQTEFDLRSFFSSH